MSSGRRTYEDDRALLERALSDIQIEKVRRLEPLRHVARLRGEPHADVETRRAGASAGVVRSHDGNVSHEPDAVVTKRPRTVTTRDMVVT